MNLPTRQASFEVELKFRIEDVEQLMQKLVHLQAVEQPSETHRDTYYRHPCRDFVQTREALRIRQVLTTANSASGQSHAVHEARITYKGPRLPGDIKARHELEWPLNPSDPGGGQMGELLTCLGFEPVATVVKTRRSMVLAREGRDVTVAIDQVEQVGSYAEVEVVADGERDVEAARGIVARLADELALSAPEARSYLSLLLARDRVADTP
ncbi:MAG: class IV adenylate cyclase [Planctomycetaceae bacterium]